MRVFTNVEKDLLKRINDSTGCNLYNLINPWTKEVSLEINRADNKIFFLFEDNSPQNQTKRLKEIQTLVIQSVNLIKLFEDKGYIFTFVNTIQLPNDPFIFGKATIISPSDKYEFPDPRISALFCEYSTKEIYVTPELNKFIMDGFITREEGRANRQYKLTRTALIVSILALLGNLIFNIHNSYIKKDKNENIYRKFELYKETIQHCNLCCQKLSTHDSNKK